MGFTPEQSRRYEAYRRSTLSKQSVKKVMQHVAGKSTKVTANSVMVMAGIAKVMGGQIVEEACIVQEEWKEVGNNDPLLPKHIREAVRRLTERGQMPRRGGDRDRRI